MEGDIRALKSFVLGLIINSFRQFLGAKFDENNTSAYFNSKHWQMRADLNGNMSFLSIKCLLLANLPYDKY